MESVSPIGTVQQPHWQLIEEIWNQKSNPFIVCDQLGKIVFLNNKAHDLFGHTCNFNGSHVDIKYKDSTNMHMVEKVAGKIIVKNDDGSETETEAELRLKPLTIEGKKYLSYTLKPDSSDENWLQWTRQEVRTAFHGLLSVVSMKNSSVDELISNPIEWANQIIAYARRAELSTELSMDLNQINHKKIQFTKSSTTADRLCEFIKQKSLDILRREFDIHFTNKAGSEASFYLDTGCLGHAIIYLLQALTGTESTEAKIFVEFSILDTNDLEISIQYLANQGSLKHVQNHKRLFNLSELTYNHDICSSEVGFYVGRKLIEFMNGSMKCYPSNADSTYLKIVLSGLNKVNNSENAPSVFNGVIKDCLKGAKILVVDDNIMMQKTLARSLKSMGAILDVASNGQEAVDAVNNSTYSLILMDWTMPVMDGGTASKIIHDFENGKVRKTPIIMLTATPGQLLKDLQDDGVICDLLDKPVDNKTLAGYCLHYLNA
ncbi:MAG: response regulator [Parachlamydiales bacterium]|nr:response regulator [Parachlamydiales bacterium]